MGFKNWFCYLIEYIQNTYFKLILLFIFSFIGFGLYSQELLEKHLIISLILLVINLYLIKQLLYKRIRFTKLLVIIVILYISFSFTQTYSQKIFHKTGIIAFLDNDIINKISLEVDDVKTNIETEIAKSSKERDMETFDYINQLREEKGLRKMEWDNRAYEMAVSRSKDMADRNYFSHLTPEGQCMQTLKSKYGFGSGETVAENIWMISGGTANPNEALTSWIGSPGHNANLFYKDHVKGAIGCYGRYCVFNGVNNDPYGLGAAPCSMYD
ncbi:MAG: CAP domain-containing protein [Nanoarchaeota archaeon]|nr:CAP domain-containing protein [Nanoarchaeota archaeon]